MAARIETPEDVDVRIGRCVKVAMTARGATAQDLGRALGAGKSEISRRLRGETPFKPRELVIAAAFLGTSPGVFFEDPEELLQNRK